jgi:hypothetical protein
MNVPCGKRKKNDSGGRLPVSASRHETLKEWELVSGRELRALAGHLPSGS